jgi:hypothetical protein
MGATDTQTTLTDLGEDGIAIGGFVKILNYWGCLKLFDGSLICLGICSRISYRHTGREHQRQGQDYQIYFFHGYHLLWTLKIFNN